MKHLAPAALVTVATASALLGTAGCYTHHSVDEEALVPSAAVIADAGSDGGAAVSADPCESAADPISSIVCGLLNQGETPASMGLDCSNPGSDFVAAAFCAFFEGGSAADGGAGGLLGGGLFGGQPQGDAGAGGLLGGGLFGGLPQGDAGAGGLFGGGLFGGLPQGDGGAGGLFGGGLFGGFPVPGDGGLGGLFGGFPVPGDGGLGGLFGGGFPRRDAGAAADAGVDASDAESAPL